MGCQFSLFSWLTSKSRNFPPTNFMILCCTTSSRLGANIYCRFNTMALLPVFRWQCPRTTGSSIELSLGSEPWIMRLANIGWQSRDANEKAIAVPSALASHLSHALLDAEAVHLAKSVETSLEPRALTVNRLTAKIVYVIRVHDRIATKFRTTKIISNDPYELFTKICTHKNNPLYGTCKSACLFLWMQWLWVLVFIVCLLAHVLHVASLWYEGGFWHFNKVDWRIKIIEIQPGLEPGSSEFRSDALTTELLELWHWSREYDVIIHWHDSIPNWISCRPYSAVKVLK